VGVQLSEDIKYLNVEKFLLAMRSKIPSVSVIFLDRL